jgi:hypothetical protein
MFWNPEYSARIEKETGVQREMLWMKEEGIIKTYRMKFTPEAELPRAVAKFTGTKKNSSTNKKIASTLKRM